MNRYLFGMLIAMKIIEVIKCHIDSTHNTLI